MSGWDPFGTSYPVQSKDWSVSGEPKVTAAVPFSSIRPQPRKPLFDPFDNGAQAQMSPETQRGLDPNYQPSRQPSDIWSRVTSTPVIGGLAQFGSGLIGSLPGVGGLTSGDPWKAFRQQVPGTSDWQAEQDRQKAQQAADTRSQLAGTFHAPETDVWKSSNPLEFVQRGMQALPFTPEFFGVGKPAETGSVFTRERPAPLSLPEGPRPLALPARIPERPAPTVGFPPKPVEAPPIAAQPPFLKTLGLPETKMLPPGPTGLADLQRRYGTYAASRAFEKNPIGATDLAPKREPIQFPARAVTGEPTGLGAPTAAERAIESNGGRSAATDRTVAQLQRDIATRRPAQRLAVLPQGMSDASLAKFRDDVAAAEQRRQTLETPNYQKPLMADARARVEAKRNPSQVPITSAQLSQQLEDSLRARGVEPKGIPNENVPTLPQGRGQPATGLGGLVRGEGGEARVDLGLSDLFKGRTNPAAEAQIREARANRMGELGPVGFLRDEGGSAKVGLGLGGRDPLKVARQDLLAGKITRAEYDRRVGPEQASAPLFQKKASSGLGGRPNASVGRGPGNPMNQAPSGVAGAGPQLPSAPQKSGVINAIKANPTRALEDVMGVTKTAVTAMSPGHFMLRHALPFMASHPVAWLKGPSGVVNSALKGAKWAEERTVFMQKNLERNGVGNTYIGKAHLGIAGGEEAVASNLLQKVPVVGEVVKRLGIGFTMGLNEIRYAAVQGAINTSVLLAKKGIVRPLNAMDRMAIADSINKFSGRGFNTGMGDKINFGKTSISQADLGRLANVPFFSPQLATARVQMLKQGAQGYAQVLNDIAHRRPLDPVGLERARLATGALIGISAMYVLGQAVGGKIVTNPVSGSAGKIEFPDSAAARLAAKVGAQVGLGAQNYGGSVFFDPTEAESGLLRTVARSFMALKDMQSGKKELQQGMGTSHEYTLPEIFGAYLHSIASPIFYQVENALSGHPTDWSQVVLPMWSTAGEPPAATPSPTQKPAKTAAPSKTAAPRRTPTPTR